MKPPPPGLSPEVLTDLESKGVPAIRARLAQLPLPSSIVTYPNEQQPFYVLRRDPNLGTVSITRGEAETWLAWKQAEEDHRAADTLRWTKWGGAAAVAATVFGFLAVLEGMGHKP